MSEDFDLADLLDMEIGQGDAFEILLKMDLGERLDHFSSMVADGVICIDSGVKLNLLTARYMGQFQKEDHRVVLVKVGPNFEKYRLIHAGE